MPRTPSRRFDLLGMRPIDDDFMNFAGDFCGDLSLYLPMAKIRYP